jgi:hypothetical protein
VYIIHQPNRYQSFYDRLMIYESLPSKSCYFDRNLGARAIKESVHELALTMQLEIHELPQDALIDRVCKQIFKGIHALQLLDSLRSILLKAVEIGINEKRKFELNKIRQVCNTIIERNPSKIPHIPRDLWGKILGFTSFPEATKAALIGRLFRDVSRLGQMMVINEEKSSIKQYFPYVSINYIIDWIITNPFHRRLEFVNFSGVMHFTNDALEILTSNCPNIKHLSIAYTDIEDDALKFLPPKLLTLDIGNCLYLASDALKHLGSELKKLVITGCTQLESDALKRIPSGLKILIMDNCKNLESEALKRLPNGLTLLSIRSCSQFKDDSLKLVPSTVEYLDLSWCFELSLNPLYDGFVNLKHLEAVGYCNSKIDNLPKNLKSLNIDGSQLISLEGLPEGLLSLSIRGCVYLHSLSYLPKSLTSLTIDRDTKLERYSLEFLPIKLRNLFVYKVSQLDLCCVPKHVQICDLTRERLGL